MGNTPQRVKWSGTVTVTVSVSARVFSGVSGSDSDSGCEEKIINAIDMLG
jgi:hypothetical protein